MYLRQSTASQTRTIGPFIDDTDFKTVKNALTIANTDILLKKNGAASGAKNSGGATADGSNGMYSLTFDATDSNTVGELAGSVKVANALVVPFKFVVVEEAVYDAMFAFGAAGYATSSDISGITSAVSTAANVIAPHLAPDYSFQIVRDDDYYSSESANFTATIGASPSLSGATITLEIQDDVSEAFDSTNLVSTSASASGTTTQTITADIPRTVTDDLSEGWHAYRVKAVLSNGHVRTLVRGRVNILSWGDDAP